MSIIGPRPDLDSEMALYQGDEGRKLEVTPGITGYAQAYGRNSLPWHDRLGPRRVLRRPFVVLA